MFVCYWLLWCFIVVILWVVISRFSMVLIIKRSIYLMKCCEWVNVNLLEIKYYDEEWGVLFYDDCLFFEMFILESV